MLLRPARRRTPQPSPRWSATLLRQLGPGRIAVGRVGVGVAMLARPRLLPATLGVDSATSARVGWVVQMLGAREVALGTGTLLAARRGDGRGLALWLLAAAFSDAADALAVGGATARGRVGRAPGALVAASAAGLAGAEVAELLRGRRG